MVYGSRAVIYASLRSISNFTNIAATCVTGVSPVKIPWPGKRTHFHPRDVFSNIIWLYRHECEGTRSSQSGPVDLPLLAPKSDKSMPNHSRRNSKNWWIHDEDWMFIWVESCPFLAIATFLGGLFSYFYHFELVCHCKFAGQSHLISAFISLTTAWHNMTFLGIMYLSISCEDPFISLALSIEHCIAMQFWVGCLKSPQKAFILVSMSHWHNNVFRLYFGISHRSSLECDIICILLSDARVLSTIQCHSFGIKIGTLFYVPTIGSGIDYTVSHLHYKVQST